MGSCYRCGWLTGTAGPLAAGVEASDVAEVSGVEVLALSGLSRWS
jgi:hypothetical protein